MEQSIGGPEARQAAILDYLAATGTGTARLDALAERFEVSAMTMHRDLDALARQGSVERVRGGVRYLARPLIESDVAVRRAANAETKIALVRRVRDLLNPGEVVALDDSTTVASIAPLLPEVQPAALITHSLALLGVLSRAMPGTPLIGLGGRYVATTDSFLGAATCQQMRGLSADVSLISTTSVRAGALYHPDEEAARTKTACMRVGQRRILVCDSTKAGAPGVHYVADLKEFDEIVVDSHLDGETLARMEASGARLHLVEAPRPEAANTRERITP